MNGAARSTARRAAATLAATFAVLGMLLEAKTGAGGPTSALAAALPRGAVAAATRPATPPATGAPPSPGASSPEAPSPTTTGTAAPAVRTLTGAAYDVFYGIVQVQVTLSGNRITDVAALQLPSDRAHSARISNYAAPILRREALAAQGATIDSVSGASYTSAGYADSLQSALDQANR